MRQGTIFVCPQSERLIATDLLAAVSPSPVQTRTANYIARKIRNCKRKLRHVHYLSALLHLMRLGDLELLAIILTAGSCVRSTRSSTHLQFASNSSRLSVIG